MVSWSIKWFILLIILSQVSAAAESIENTGSDSKTSDISISNTTNANFYIINTTSGFISDAIVIVEDSAGNKVVNISNADGKASVQVSPGQANITIKADGYEEINNNNKSVMILENATFTYVLIPSIDKTFWHWVAWLLPLFLMLLFSLSEESEKHYHWYAYLPIISWAGSFLILIKFSVDANYDVFFLDPRLKVSLFVPIAAFLGAASYITVSILAKLEKKPPNSAWKIIYFAYGRRLLMAPYIAIIALFTITGVGDINNKGGVLFFAYFVGLYTKNIEGTLEEIGKKFLTDKQKTQLEENESGTIDIVKRLGVSANVYDKLSKQGIKNIGDLLAITPEKITTVTNSEGLDPNYLPGLKTKAIVQEKGIQEMKVKLGLDDELIDMLVDAGFYSMIELSRIETNCKSAIALNIGIDENCLTEIIQNAKYEINNLYLFSWDDITENDYETLKESLKQNFGIDWVNTATFETKDNGKTINVSFENKSLSLKRNDEKNEVNLEIKDDRTYKLIPRKENSKLNIYGHFP